MFPARTYLSIKAGQTVKACLTFLCVFMLFNSIAKPAYAYADPGAGLFYIQILGSTFAGFIFLLRKKLSDATNRILHSARISQQDNQKNI